MNQLGGIEFRPAHKGDVDRLVPFVTEGMRADLYPMVPSRAKIAATVNGVIASPTNFNLMAVDTGRVVGAIAAVVAEIMFFERFEAHVIVCRATVPGVGRKMIAALRQWADSNIMIRRVQVPQEFHADPRALKLLARYGFDQRVTTCVYYKR